MPADQETGDILYGYQTLYNKVQSRLQRIYIANNPDSYFSLMALIELIRMQPIGTVDTSLNNSYNRLSDRVKNTTQGVNFFNTTNNETLLINTAAPNFNLRDSNGKTIMLSELRGKYVLLDFWASWCGPCRGESPYLLKAYRDFSGKNLTILSVSIDQAADKEKWLNAIAADHTGAWLHIIDSEKSVADLYHIKSIPMNFLIDPSGNVIALNLRGDALAEKLRQVLQ